MTQKPKHTWKEAFLKSPGPDSKKEAAQLFLKGLFMGTADIIPGVSGGTIALITGIYQRLIAAVTSVNAKFIGHVIRGDLKQGLSEIHIRFLLPLLFGIATAIITFARVTHFLLKNHPVPTWALFFGLIAASIYIVGKKVDRWTPGRIAGVAGGVVLGVLVTGMIPTSTPDTMLYVFGSGVIAICAMILPGISGAFLLLILGKYVYVTGALKNPFLLENIQVILVFCTGCAAGLAGFSRFINRLLKNHYSITMATLTGLMAGSMQKIWPWKNVLETRVVREKIHVIREANIIPESVDGEVLLAVGLAVAGVVAVLLMDHISSEK